MTNRTVHARTAYTEIVRYDRVGKWWVEYLSGDGTYHDGNSRFHVSLAAAADLALSFAKNGGEVFLDLPGGNAFDRKVKDWLP